MRYIKIQFTCVVLFTMTFPALPGIVEVQGAVLDVNLVWPDGVKPRPVGIVLLPKSSDSSVQKGIANGAGKLRFMDVAPGKYVLAMDESLAGVWKMWVYETVEVTEGIENVSVKAEINRADVVPIRVAATVQGGENKQRISGKLLYWCLTGNVCEVELPEAGIVVPLVNGQKYTLEVVPAGRRATKAIVGSIDPKDYLNDALKIPVKVAKPTYTYTWRIRRQDKEEMPANSNIYFNLKRITQEKRYSTEGIDPIPSSSLSEDTQLNEKGELYDLKDGTYELSGRIAGNNWYTNALISERLLFVVKDGNATPETGELVFSTSNMGQLKVNVRDQHEKAIANAFVELQDEGRRVWSGRTNIDGNIQIPSVPCGEYSLITQGAGFPLLKQKVKVIAGSRRVTLSYKDMIDVEVRVVSEKNKTFKHMEGSWVPSLAFGRRVLAANSDGVFRGQFFPADFPLLLYAYIDSGQDVPHFAAVKLSKNAVIPLTLSVPNNPVRDYDIVFPVKLLQNGDHRLALWLGKTKDDLTPAIIIPIRTFVAAKDALMTDDTIKCAKSSGKARIPSGKHYAWLRIASRSGETLVPVGEVSVPSEGSFVVKVPTATGVTSED